ncbi:MAG TPA: hypothetical protein VKY74_20200 [Chloroflexia bacterium]|nr:hypothetical protein [Chloroflexia bacterium]
MTRYPAPDGGVDGWSHFEFLDEAAPESAAPAAAESVAPPALLPVPGAGGNPWAAMDADYRPIPIRTRLPLRELLRRHATPEAIVQRSRFERPVITLWLLVSCWFQGPGPWITWGLAIIAFSFAMGATFAVNQYDGLAGVYRAIGLAQVLVGLCAVIDPGPFLPFLGAYCLGTLLAWVFVECRYLYRREKQQAQWGFWGL